MGAKEEYILYAQEQGYSTSHLMFSRWTTFMITRFGVLDKVGRGYALEWLDCFLKGTEWCKADTQSREVIKMVYQSEWGNY